MLEVPRARTHQVEHGDAPRVARIASRHLDPLERGDEVGGRERLAQALPALELVEQPRDRRDAAKVEPRGVARPAARRGRRRRPPSCAAARARPRPARQRRGASRSATSGASRSRSVSASTDSGASTARPRSRPSAKSTLERAMPEYGERRKAYSSARPAGRPREAEQGEQRVAERRRGQPHAAVDRVRDAGGSEHRLERRAPALDRRDDERDLLGRGAVAQERQHLVRDELRACRACRRPRGRRPPRRSAAATPDGGSNSVRSSHASAGGANSAERGASSCGARRRAPRRSSAVRCSDANAARPGS